MFMEGDFFGNDGIFFVLILFGPIAAMALAALSVLLACVTYGLTLRFHLSKWGGSAKCSVPKRGQRG